MMLMSFSKTFLFLCFLALMPTVSSFKNDTYHDVHPSIQVLNLSNNNETTIVSSNVDFVVATVKMEPVVVPSTSSSIIDTTTTTTTAIQSIKSSSFAIQVYYPAVCFTTETFFDGSMSSSLPLFTQEESYDDFGLNEQTIIPEPARNNVAMNDDNYGAVEAKQHILIFDDNHTGSATSMMGSFIGYYGDFLERVGAIASFVLWTAFQILIALTAVGLSCFVLVGALIDFVFGVIIELFVYDDDGIKLWLAATFVRTFMQVATFLAHLDRAKLQGYVLNAAYACFVLCCMPVYLIYGAILLLYHAGIPQFILQIAIFSIRACGGAVMPAPHYHHQHHKQKQADRAILQAYARWIISTYGPRKALPASPTWPTMGDPRLGVNNFFSHAYYYPAAFSIPQIWVHRINFGGTTPLMLMAAPPVAPTAQESEQSWWGIKIVFLQAIILSLFKALQITADKIILLPVMALCAIYQQLIRRMSRIFIGPFLVFVPKKQERRFNFDDQVPPVAPLPLWD